MFGEGGNNGDMAIVGWIRGISGLIAEEGDKVPPGYGKFAGCETGVGKITLFRAGGGGLKGFFRFFLCHCQTPQD